MPWNSPWFSISVLQLQDLRARYLGFVCLFVCLFTWSPSCRVTPWPCTLPHPTSLRGAGFPVGEGSSPVLRAPPAGFSPSSLSPHVAVMFLFPDVTFRRPSRCHSLGYSPSVHCVFSFFFSLLPAPHRPFFPLIIKLNFPGVLSPLNYLPEPTVMR